MIVWHDGSKYELDNNEVGALKALACGYERVSRMDGVRLMVLDLAYKSALGFRITTEGRKALEKQYGYPENHDGRAHADAPRGSR